MPPSLLPNAPSANSSSGKPLNIPQTHAQALELHKAGRLAEAERLYAAILAVRPDHFDALHLLGLVKMAQGQLGEALRLIGAAMRARRRRRRSGSTRASCSTRSRVIRKPSTASIKRSS